MMVTSYLPGGSNNATNRPLLSVERVFLRLVSTLCTSTLAPLITAPDASVTVPWIVLVVICDWAAANTATRHRNEKTANILLVTHPPEGENRLEKRSKRERLL